MRLLQSPPIRRGVRRRQGKAIDDAKDGFGIDFKGISQHLAPGWCRYRVGEGIRTVSSNGEKLADDETSSLYAGVDFLAFSEDSEAGVYALLWDTAGIQVSGDADQNGDCHVG